MLIYYIYILFHTSQKMQERLRHAKTLIGTATFDNLVKKRSYKLWEAHAWIVNTRLQPPRQTASQGIKNIKGRYLLYLPNKQTHMEYFFCLHAWVDWVCYFGVLAFCVMLVYFHISKFSVVHFNIVASNAQPW